MLIVIFGKAMAAWAWPLCIVGTAWAVAWGVVRLAQIQEGGG